MKAKTIMGGNTTWNEASYCSDDKYELFYERQELNQLTS